MGQLKDKDIIALFDSRDERAITELDRKFGNYCRTIAVRVLNNDHDAEECVNDAYLKVWNSIPPAIPEKLDNYLAEIVRNTATDRRRRDLAQRRDPEGGFVSAESIAPGSGPVTDPWTDPLGLGKGSAGAMIADGIDPDGSRVLRLMEEYLWSLKPKKRKIFFARFYYERPIEDIARIMDVPKGTVLSNLKRTRDGLKRFLESKGIEL